MQSMQPGTMHPTPEHPDPHAVARRRMCDAVRADFEAMAARTGIAQPDRALMAALARVPRHRFVPAAWQDLAYADRPLPIGHGQTISQPFIVALMTALLQPRSGQHVLEIGTGCGYQAAVLAALDVRVTSVEIVPELATQARHTLRALRALGVQGVDVHVGDGRLGWPADAPYDAIIATAAGTDLPPAWPAQLAAGGRIVAPVGASDDAQELVRWTRDASGGLQRQPVLGVRFVPLVAGSRARAQGGSATKTPPAGGVSR